MAKNGIAKIETMTPNELYEFQINLEEREKSIKDLEAIRDRLEADYRAKEGELTREKENILRGKTLECKNIEKDIANRKKELEDLNLKISQKNLELINSENTLQVELDRKKSEQLAKINDEISNQLKKEYEEIHSTTKSLLNSVSTNVSSNVKDLEKEYEKLLNQYDKIAKGKLTLIENEKEALEKIIDEYEKKLEEASNIEAKRILVESKERSITTREKSFDNALNIELKNRYGELTYELEEAKKSKEKWEDKCHKLAVERDDLSAENEELKATGIEALKSQLDEYRKKYIELQSKYSAFTDVEYQTAISKSKLYDSLSDGYQKLLVEKQNLDLEILKFKNEAAEINTLRKNNEILQLHISTNETYLAKLREEIENLKSRINDASSAVIASESIEQPYEEFKKFYPDSDSSKDEIKWLDSILDKCKASGFKFSKRLMYSFHACLKTSAMSPLTVLAGISGTGKSKLPQLYARFGGIYFISLPVQPDWDSPQSLFGYFNSIEKRFNATTLLRAMVSFQKEQGGSEKIYDLHDRVLLILLDEMNLAHVELYFADLLSKLEEQRGEQEVKTFEVDLGAGVEKYKVRLTRNILWSGTMNEDETTKSLSDKVIDRGNIISFPRPTKFERYNDKGLAKESLMISRTVWEDWNTNNKLVPDEEIDAIINKYCEAVMQINLKLRYVNRALGHRVWQSIENYMLSHPIVASHKDNKDELKKALQYAFEEAVVYKIVPKLRGIELSDEVLEQCLNPIHNILAEDGIATGIAQDFDEALHNSTTSVFVWDSANYLEKDYEF